MSYRPIGIMTDCGNGYGVAMVQDGDNPSVRASVDMNTTDGTANPRIQVNGTWVDVDAAFVANYNGMRSTRALSAESRTAACRAINGGTDPAPEPPPPPTAASRRIGWGWLVVPTLSIGGAYAVNRIARADLGTASTDPGQVGTILDVGYSGLNILYGATHTPMTRHQDSGWSLGYNIGALGVGGGLLIFSLTQPSGSGTPELGTSMALLTNGTAGLVYGDADSGRSPVRFYTGFGLQLAFGVAGTGLWLGGVGAAPTISDRPMIAPPGMAGARGVDNPAAGPRFPGLNTEFRDVAFGNFAGAVINFVDYTWISPPGTDAANAQAGRPTIHLGAMTPPGGGFGLQTYGSF